MLYSPRVPPRECFTQPRKALSFPSDASARSSTPALSPSRGASKTFPLSSGSVNARSALEICALHLSLCGATHDNHSNVVHGRRSPSPRPATSVGKRPTRHSQHSAFSLNGRFRAARSQWERSKTEFAKKRNKLCQTINEIKVVCAPHRLEPRRSLARATLNTFGRHYRWIASFYAIAKL